MVALAGCAPLPPPATAPSVRAGSARDTARAPHPSGQDQAGVARPAPAAVDSGPSADALAVLETIPEPLLPSERVPPPDRAPTVPPDSSAIAVPEDDTLETREDSTRGEIPVPAPTTPLGDRTSPAVTGAPPPAAQPAVTPPAGTAPSANAAARGASGPSPALNDTCWRVQFAAPPERARAEQLRQAAESLLLVPMVVEPEARRFKVRTRGCMDRAAADLMRARALASGFKGAFRLESPKP
jgi:hypothetical protein